MADIQAKYQKLATEYSKLRAQLPVLKKAIVEEQEKEEGLHDSLKVKDQSIRKYEQEIDSLVFRNQQLTARVGILQQELDDSKQPRSRKHKKLVQHSEDPSSLPDFSSQASVFGEELQSKIEENVRLHKQVYESDHEHQQTVNQLQDRLHQIEAETNHQQQSLQIAAHHSQSQVDKLQEDKALLEMKLQKQDSSTRDSKQQMLEAKNQLDEVTDQLSSQVDQATATLNNKLPFNDSEHEELNRLNVPPHNRKIQLQSRELISQAHGLIRQLVQGLSNFYTYSEQRSKVYPVDSDSEPLSDANKKFCQHLHSNTQYLRPLEQNFRIFSDSLQDDITITLETASGLQNFAENFKSYISFAKKVLPYQVLSLDEENAISSCTSMLETKNKELSQAFQVYTASLDKLGTYISIIASQSEVSCDHPNSSHYRMFQQLSKALTDYHESTREMSKLYNAKVSLEHQLPTATQKLRATDECIMSALVSMVTCTSKISAFFAGNLEFFKMVIQTRSRELEAGLTQRSHPDVNSYRQRAVQYMQLISQHAAESVPYNMALLNKHTLVSSTESRDSLAQQVAVYQDRVGRLDQDKEHWLLEAQLTQVKLEKEQKKVQQLEQRIRVMELQLSGSIQDNVDITIAGSSHTTPLSGAPSAISGVTAPGGPTTTSDTSMLGQVETQLSGDGDADSREKLIRQHFSNRVLDLTTQVQTADSKALYFHVECRSLHKQLGLLRTEKDHYRDDVSSANQNVAQLKDELQTTARSYEGQLSMMSEHLAAMNEKLTTQKDEIDSLKYQLQNSNKGNQKTRLR